MISEIVSHDNHNSDIAIGNKAWNLKLINKRFEKHFSRKKNFEIKKKNLEVKNIYISKMLTLSRSNQERTEKIGYADWSEQKTHSEWENDKR